MAGSVDADQPTRQRLRTIGRGKATERRVGGEVDPGREAATGELRQSVTERRSGPVESSSAWPSRAARTGAVGQGIGQDDGRRPAMIEVGDQVPRRDQIGSPPPPKRSRAVGGGQVEADHPSGDRRPTERNHRPGGQVGQLGNRDQEPIWTGDVGFRLTRTSAGSASPRARRSRNRIGADVPRSRGGPETQASRTTRGRPPGSARGDQSHAQRRRMSAR